MVDVKFDDLPDIVQPISRKINGKYIKRWKGDPNDSINNSYNTNIYNAALRKCKKRKISFEHDNIVFRGSKELRPRTFDIKVIVNSCITNIEIYHDDDMYWPDDIE